MFRSFLRSNTWQALLVISKKNLSASGGYSTRSISFLYGPASEGKIRGTMVDAPDDIADRIDARTWKMVIDRFSFQDVPDPPVCICSHFCRHSVESANCRSI